MTVKLASSAFVSRGTTPIALSSIFTTTASAANPAFLVLTGLDRDEYAAGASTATGSFSGAGNTAAFSRIGDDGRGAGVVFAYQSATGRYYSGTYGFLDQMQYVPSVSFGDVTNISLFGTSDLNLATRYAANPYALMQLDPGGYIGSATVATQPSFTAPVPPQATPQSIAASAISFVGKAWNMNGCWVLASTIAAEAGASLPVQSTAIGLPGQANGEWIVAFNGPTGQSANWQSMVTMGEIVVIGTTGGGGHITTVVSGTGGSAMLVDNITYEGASGQILNPANDGSSSDVIVAAPHLASQEWAGVQASSVVIYALDVPKLIAKVATDTVAARGVQTLASLFSATDPANRPIASYQVYSLSASGSFTVNGVNQTAHSAATALSVTSLFATSYVAGASAGSDSLEIRAFNGNYWNDWQALAINVTAAARLAAPVLAVQTAAQTWAPGQRVVLALPANTFTDPQGQPLAYSATLANGQLLPGWLRFDATTDGFTGTAPITPQTLGLKVTATDTSGLSVSDVFAVSIAATGPVLAHQTADLKAVDGHAFSFALPADTFTDVAGQHLAYVAYQIGGPSVTSWLRFNPTTATLYGTAPNFASGTVRVQITATDDGRLSASESFNLSYAPPATAAGFAGSATLSISSAVPAFSQIGLRA